jgi:molybdenum cofactor sulfurtransferase
VWTGRIYLDHGGTTIYSRSLIEAFSEKMMYNLYGNPHSASDPAKLSGHAVDSIREKALHFFKADPEHFDLVFTANATAAIKLVAESFRDLASASSVSGNFWYGYHKDAHTSIVGVRECTNGNHHCFVSDREVEEWLNGYPTHFNSSNDGALPGLFAYPGQSNMTGRRLPLSWTAKLRQSTKTHHQNTYSLLDAAALATTTQLDYSDPDTAPDFTALSFYKIFGFPDLGALIVRKKSGHILSWRKYFGGGTVNMVTVFHEATVMRKEHTIHDGLEDGTLPFHSIIALGCAMDTHKKLYGSMKAISRHTSFLGHRLYNRLSSLCHYNGRPAVVIYNDVADQYPYSDPTTQGATIAFNLVRADGSTIRYSLVEQLANERHIYLRSGGLCNAGGIASHLKVEPWQFKRAWSAGHRCGEPSDLEVINGKPTGVVRASLGAMSTVGDVDTFIVFLSDTFLEHPNEELVSPPKIELQNQVPSKNGLHLDRRDASFDFDAEGRVAPHPPQVPRHKASQLSLKMKLPQPVIRTKRSFFTRKCHETSRIPPSEVSPGMSEFSGSTLTAEDVDLQELVKQNMAMVLGEGKSGGNKGKSSLRFWKGSKGVASGGRLNGE